TYRYTAWVRSAAANGTARIRVREYLLASAALLGQISSPGVRLTPSWQQLIVDYTSLSAGSSLDLQVKDNPLLPAEVFLTDDIAIRDITGVPGIVAALGAPDPDARGSDVVESLLFASAVYPSPVQTSAVLTFATTKMGALRVDIVDLAGREVRRLDDESQAPAGTHTLTIDRTRNDGQRMSPGLYFYRIVADEGRITGRFAVLR
ncbi:MAG: FlgD immunoglobulin-like domain containing protein, partial [Candidatus Eiseniibacteriota bacterium]